MLSEGISKDNPIAWSLFLANKIYFPAFCDPRTTIFWGKNIVMTFFSENLSEL